MNREADRWQQAAGGKKILACCLLFFWFSSSSFGAVTLPLQGYYRSGRYMPVRVDSGAGLTGGGGVMATDVESGADSVVPVLVFGNSHALADGTNLQPVGEGERLIVSDGDAKKDGAVLFGEGKFVGIPVNASDPLPGPAAAWEALDGVVLDPAAMGRIDEGRRSVLLAAGVVLASRGDLPPDVRWPWRRRGSLWVLRYVPAGPAGELVDGSVYSPIYAWSPGLPVFVRREVVLGGVMLGILVLGMAVWRSKIVVIGIIALAAISTIGVIVWRHSAEIVDQACGDILVASDLFLQRDSWVYERAREDGIRRIKWDGFTHPVAASLQQASGVRIVAEPGGGLAFQYLAHRGETIAFLRREVKPMGNLPTIEPTHSSPLQDLARDAYLLPGGRIVGEQAASGNGWNSVFIQTTTPASDR